MEKQTEQNLTLVFTSFRASARALMFAGERSRWKASLHALFSPIPGSFFSSPTSLVKECELCSIFSHKHKTFFEL
jgi:hypothetical protein